MIRTYDEGNVRELIDQQHEAHGGEPGFLPRRTIYGSIEASIYGLTPIHEYPDKLIDPKDYKAVVQDCHDRQIFAMYHQAATDLWTNPPWNQDGLNYCWAWSLAGTIMGCRATEGQEPIKLAPTTLGWLVRYRNSGYYLDAAINGANQRGIAPVDYVPSMHSRSESSFKQGWKEAALNFRPTEWFDCDPENMVQHGISVLATGKPLYIAYNWWSHAVECVGVRFDGSTLIWIIQNSHNEEDVIEIAGKRGVPDEAYGIRSTVISGKPDAGTAA